MPVQSVVNFMYVFFHCRNKCNNCGCSRTDHKIAGAAKVDIPYLSHLKFGDVPIGSSSPVLSQLEWYPSDLNDEQVSYYYVRCL